MRDSIIFHIPHSSNTIPEDIRRQFNLSDQELDRELLSMTDLYTDDLFSPVNENDIAIIYPVSRLVVDPERFINDKMEAMSEKGMGVIYTKTSYGKEFRIDISNQEKRLLINSFYYWHHNNLINAVKHSLQKFDNALIVDCHSFPAIPLPYELNQSSDRPDICIGTDDFHTPEALTNEIVKLFKEKKYSVAINRPFSGSLVPGIYYQKNSNVHSIMIEVNRNLYMNGRTGMKIPNFAKVKSDLQWITDKLHD